MHENGRKVQQDLIERNEEVMKQEMENKIREATYNEKYKWMEVDGLPKYRWRERDSEKLIARVKRGNTEKWNKYGVRKRKDYACYVGEVGIHKNTG